MNKTALLFAGQGAQVVGMGKDLAEAFPTARSWFDRANTALGYDLSSICFTGPEATLTDTENAQPGIYLVSWVALQLLKERVPGLEFHGAAGLSLGELTALAAAEAFTFEDGLRVVRQRGRFMQEACNATKGGMAAILGLNEEEVRRVCAESGVELANLNCPGQIVISGPADKIPAACELAKTRGAKRIIPLPVAGAYHSSLMASAQPKLESVLAKAEVKSPRVPVYSNVTAQPHLTPESTRTTLVQQVTSSVRWEESMRQMLAAGFTRFIEVGPGHTLTTFIRKIDKSVFSIHIADVPSLEAAVKALTTG